MRTKALLLAAAFAAAGVATSTAQVYSVNAVGYVNVDLTPGFNMVSNPLNAADNSIKAIYKNVQGGVPVGYKIFAFNSATGSYDTILWNDLDGIFEPDDLASKPITPGNGVFVYLPSNAATTKLTFVGEVPQGTLSNPLPKGFSIKASQVPQAAKPDAIGLPGQPGDKIFYYNKGTKSYDTYLYNDLDENWGTLPTIQVGEAFFLYRAASAGTWTRTFSVNNPT
jgi:hypothetical protein